MLNPIKHMLGNRHIYGQKENAYDYSDTGGTLEKIKQPIKPLFSRRALHFKRGQRKCFCIGGQIMPTRNNSHRKSICVLCPLSMKNKRQKSLSQSKRFPPKHNIPTREKIHWNKQHFGMR